MKITTLAEAKRAAFMGAYRGMSSQGWKYAHGLRNGLTWLVPDSARIPGGDVGTHFLYGRMAPVLQEWYGTAPHYDRTQIRNFVTVLAVASMGASCFDSFERIRERGGWPVPS